MQKIIKIKPCNDCKVVKSLDKFNKRSNYNKTESIYLFGICKNCMTLRSRNWRDQNKKQFNEYQRRYFKKKYHAMSPEERKVFNKKRKQHD